MTDETKPKSQRHQLLRAAMSMSVITMGSRVLGLVREQVRAHLLGTSLASDAFGIAFQIPNLLRRLLAEGAMSAGFIPVLTELREKHGDEKGFEFARQFINLALLVMTIVSSLGARNKVDLPQPLGPTSASTSPVATVSVTWSTAMVSP